MVSRVVTLAFEPDQLVKLNGATDPRKAQEAIGYLSLWAAHEPRYTYCHIWIADAIEVCAAYCDVPREPGIDGQYPRATYTIGAVWHGDHFGFHS